MPPPSASSLPALSSWANGWPNALADASCSLNVHSCGFLNHGQPSDCEMSKYCSGSTLRCPVNSETISSRLVRAGPPVVSSVRTICIWSPLRRAPCPPPALRLGGERVPGVLGVENVPARGAQLQGRRHLFASLIRGDPLALELGTA